MKTRDVIGHTIVAILAVEERDMIYLALLNKGNELRILASGRAKDERDDVLLESGRYIALARKVREVQASVHTH